MAGKDSESIRHTASSESGDLSLPDGFYEGIASVLEQARGKAYRAVNTAMVHAYWEIGRRIVEEQGGEERAAYGRALVKELSKRLTDDYGQGFTTTNLKYMRQFYLAFPKGHTLCDQLSWSHYRALSRVADPKARAWYESEAAEQGWSVRTLERNISTQYYHRLLQSQGADREAVESEMKALAAPLQRDKLEFIKNPVVAEFLGLALNGGFQESELEGAIITNLQKFLLEMGKGYAFVARQQHIRTELDDFYIDLVFYNYLLKCFVLIDLKTRWLTHQDIGQMDMYVRMYDELKRGEGDNPTLGIVLCTENERDVAHFSVLNGSDQLFAAKYLTYLPTQEELKAEIERQKEFFTEQRGHGSETESDDVE
jgi:predicted nuclease of restriction endonuclease-like (RecB) superfamily